MMNYRRLTGWIATIALVAISVGLTGCEEPDWTNPDYVSKQLLEGDAVERRMVLSRISDLDDEALAKVAPALAKVYLEDGPNQKEAMSQLVQIRHESAKDAYIAELKSNATGYAGASAKALAAVGATDALDDMLAVLDSSDDPNTKVDILSSLARLPDPKVLPPLKKILSQDVDTTPITLHAHACEALGEIALQNPDAIDDETIEAVTLAVFFANNTNQTLDASCGLAIQRIGPKAAPELLKIFALERDDVQKLMLKYDRPDGTPFPQNHPKLVAAKRLASLRATEAAEVFVADLDSVKEAPSSLRGQSAVNWRIKEGQATSELIYALGDIGEPVARPILEKVVTNEIEEQWDDITDGMIELQLRQDAASALNRLGDRASASTLLKMADEGVIIDFERRAAMLEERGQPVKEVERYQFNWIVALEFAYLSDGSELEDYTKFVEETKGDYKDLGAKLESFIPLLELAAECDAKADDAAKAACYEPKLKDNSPEMRAKAAWEISRLSPEVASKTIAKNLQSEFMDTREVLVFGLYRAPSEEAVKAIEELLEEESNRGGEYKLDHFRMRLVHAYIKHTLRG